jgi:lauroyl/myristoyl acyltransferase
LSATVVALLAVGIFSLRSSIEGSSAGLTFSLLAAATAIGSLLLGYSAADEVADLLATMAKRVHRAEQRHLNLADAWAAKTNAEATETARSSWTSASP